MSEKTNNDEIDLIEVFSRIGKMFENMGKGLINIFNAIFMFFIRKIIIFGVVVGVITGGLILKKTVSAPVYESSIRLRCNYSTATVFNHLTSLNLLTEKSEDRKLLSQYLNLTEEELSQVVNIEAFWVLDKNGDGVADFIDYNNSFDEYNDTLVTRSNQLYLRLISENPEMNLAINNAIVDFVNMNEYLKKIQNLSRVETIANIEKYKIELAELDRLQERYYDFALQDRNVIVPGQNGQILYQEKDLNFLHTDVIALSAKIVGMERSLEDKKTIVEILAQSYNFVVVSKLKANLLLYNSIAIVLTILIILIIEQLKRIKRIEE